MPYGDANQIVMDMAREVLPVVEKTPVLAGVCGTDPFRIMKRFLRDVQDAGFSGVQNFPTVGLIDGTFASGPRRDRHGLRQGSRHDRARPANSDLLTCPYVFTPEEAEAMAKAGADVLIPHMGLTTKGTIGAKTALTLDEAAKRVQATGRRREEGEPGHPGALPRRPDLRAGGRAVHPRHTRRASSASSARRASSGCRPRWRSPAA